MPIDKTYIIYTLHTTTYRLHTNNFTIQQHSYAYTLIYTHKTHYLNNQNHKNYATHPQSPS